MGEDQGDSRQAGFGQYRLGGDAICVPRLDEWLQRLRSAVVQVTDSSGIQGWRLRRDLPGVASLLFATGGEKPESRLIEAALRTVEVLALDPDIYSVTIEVRPVVGHPEPELDVYISR